MPLNEIIQELQLIQAEINVLVNRQSVLIHQIESIYHPPAVLPEHLVAEMNLTSAAHDETKPEIPAQPQETIAEPEPEKAPEAISIETPAPKEEEKPTAAQAVAPIPSKANLNEKLAASKATSPVEAFAGGKIEDLSKAFTLNQKLAFIRHLFGNDADLYNSVISQLNSAGGIEEAEDILSKHIGDSEAEILTEFVNYIHRRFL